MSSLRTCNEATPDELARQLDASYDELSQLVCELGPELLTRGMPPLEANRAIIACIKKLRLEMDALR